MTLAICSYLTEESLAICCANECTEGHHTCEAYAYITADMDVLDVCPGGCFRGSPKPYAAVRLPWHGSQDELAREVIRQLLAEEDDN